MNRAMTKKIIERLLFLISVAAILVLLSFSGNSNVKRPSHELDIRISSSEGNYFICETTIRGMIIDEMDTLEGRIVDQDKIQELHKLIHSIPWVDDARVYRTINADIKVDISLKDPMVRVINRNNESFYVDYNGDVFPLSDEHTARVMLATGSIDISPGITGNLVTHDENMDEGVLARQKALFDLASYISGNEFWDAFIDHIYVREDGQFELTPKNGAHIIEFGHATDIQSKFEKLNTFYLEGITQVGWNYYSRINIAYTNQIICSK